LEKSNPLYQVQSLCHSFSVVVIIVFAVGTYMRGGFTWGIDFAGGVKLTVQFDKRVEPGEIERRLRSVRSAPMCSNSDPRSERVHHLHQAHRQGREPRREPRAHPEGARREVSRLQAPEHRNRGPRRRRIF
jgi:preprotein translocase subunit SecF